jgi:hypothetical protein
MEMPAGPLPGKLQSSRPVTVANRSWQGFLAAVDFSFLDEDRDSPGWDRRVRFEAKKQVIQSGMIRWVTTQAEQI